MTWINTRLAPYLFTLWNSARNRANFVISVEFEYRLTRGHMFLAGILCTSVDVIARDTRAKRIDQTFGTLGCALYYAIGASLMQGRFSAHVDRGTTEISRKKEEGRKRRGVISSNFFRRIRARNNASEIFVARVYLRCDKMQCEFYAVAECVARAHI